MAGRVQWEAQVDSNIKQLLGEAKQLRDELDGIKKGNYEIKLNIDEKKLESVISNLDKMLTSLGKGTGDFKEFETLSKQLKGIVSEVQTLNKAFGNINDSGVNELLSSIKNIDKSLSSLSEHIVGVNKDFSGIGKNASDNVGQINEAKKATEGLTEATKELANAQKNVGNKSNISSENQIIESQNKIQEELKQTQDNSIVVNNSLQNDAKETAKNIHYVTNVLGEVTVAYRGLRDSMAVGIISDRYHGGTFWTDNLELAKEYSEYTKVESANLEMMNPLEIEGNGANWNAIENYGNGVDEVSKKILECKENLESLIKKFGSWNQTYKIGETGADFNLSEFEKLIHEQFEDDGLPKDMLEEAKELLKIAQESYDTFHKISNDMGNVYGKHDTNTFVEMAKVNGYDGVIFKNIIDSYSGSVKDLSNVMVTFDKEQIHFLETISADPLERESYELRKTYGNISEYVGASVDKVKNKLTEVKPYIHEYVELLSELDKYDREYYTKGKLSEESEVEVKAIQDKINNLSLRDKLKEIPEIDAFTKKSPNMRWWDNQDLDDLAQQIVQRANEGQEAWSKLQTKIQETISEVNQNNTSQLDSKTESVERFTKAYNEYLSAQADLPILEQDSIINNDGSPTKSLSEVQEKIIQLEKEVPELKEYFSTLFSGIGKDETFNVLLQKYLDRISEVKSEIKSLNVETPIKDVFQGDKIDQATTSAKELDKTLEQVNIPTDSFDEVLSKLDLAKSELGEIVKITKQSVSDSEGKFHDSYTLKDKRGSTEIYGLSSNTEKGQLLRSNIVGYDAKEIEKEAKAQQKVAEQEAKALEKVNKEQQKIANNTKLEEQKRIYKELNDSLDRYATVSKRIASGNALGSDEEEAAKLQVRIEELQNSPILSKEQLELSQSKLEKIETTLEDIQKITKETTLDSLQSEIDMFNKDYDNRNIKPTKENRSGEYSQALNEYKNSIEALIVEKERLSKLDNISEEELSHYKKLKETVQENANALKAMSAAEKGSDEASRTKEIDKLTKYLDKNTRISKEAREQLEGYLAILKSGDPSVNVKEIHTAWTAVAVAEREAGREGKSFFDILKNKTIYGYAAQLAHYYLSLMDIIRYIKQGVDAVKEFDDGLTKISYTMDITKSQLNDLGKSVLDMANDLDSSINNAMQVSQIYANMNTSAEEIKKLSEPTLILSNLTGFDASTVANDIQAVTQQFEIAAEESMHIADVYDEISRNISVDYSKGIESIAEAVQVAGSTANQAGLNFEQLAAIVGKTAEKTRLEGSQIGNGLKTIMTRLSKVGKLSDEVDNETLSDASKSLHQIGVEVYNADGSYRQFDVIMGELANKWDSLTDAEKSNISFSIAATRQTNLLSAVLSNFSDSMQLAEEATNANGSALENNQKWVDSFGGHLQSLENTAKSAWINILDSETIKGGVDILNSLLKVVVGLIDKFGMLGTIGLGAGLLASFKGAGRVKIAYPHLYIYACRNKTLYA